MEENCTITSMKKGKIVLIAYFISREKKDFSVKGFQLFKKTRKFQLKERT